MRRFPWILTVLTMLALGLLVSLGVWQVRRLAWKEGLIAASENAASRPPAPLAEVLAAPVPEFRRALVVCRGVATAPFVELQTIHDGEAGVRLISACRTPSLGTFLIDRGFVSDADAMRPRVGSVSGGGSGDMPLALMAELRLTPPPGPMTPQPAAGRFYARDSAALARALRVENVSPYTLFALASTNPETPALTPSAPPAAFSNNHLGYAATWFGLAVALAGFYGVMLSRRLKSKARSS